MKAYHGSSVLFDSFDLAHALEGDGKVKFGYGVYVTGNYESAAHYAFNKKRPENRDYYVYTVEILDRTNREKARDYDAALNGGILEIHDIANTAINQIKGE